MRPLQQLTVECMNSGELEKCPRIDSAESVGFAFITHLEILLVDESDVELLGSLASQLNCLKVGGDQKHLVLRCFNEFHLTALRTLSIACFDCLEPRELNGRCWRLPEHLETLQFNGCKFTERMLEAMLPHFKNLKSLAIEHCSVSTQCIEKNCSFLAVGLKELHFSLRQSKDVIGPSALLHLPNLEHLTLSQFANITLSKQMPRLISVAIEGGQSWTSYILAEVKKINGIGKRRLRKLAHWACRLL
uniref:Uncharacterized protein n=1 Tax=Anopheles atroparvus TaxID=41427 RepID=A0AAG5DJI0_ANOAO